MNTPAPDMYDIDAKLARIIELLEAMQTPRRNSRAARELVFVPLASVVPNPFLLPSFTVTTCGSDGTSWGKSTNCS